MAARSLNAHERKIIDNIEAHGCQVMSVFDQSGELPDFSYSVGFPQSVEQPEVIVCGLKSGLSSWIINEIFRKCRAGLELADGIPVDGLLDGHSCIVRAIPAHRIDPEYFGSAIWYERYRTGKPMTEAFQIVWPGSGHGLFPWEDGADLDELQPALYEPRQLS